MRHVFSAVMLCAALAIPSAFAAGPSCSDPWITAALRSLGRGSAADTGNQGLCNINRYRGGHWDNQAQLNDAVRHSFECSDPWIGEAYVEIRSAPPIVNGTINECNASLYGSWSSFDDLKQKIQANLNARHAAAAANPWAHLMIHDYTHGNGSVLANAYIVTTTDAYIFSPSAANIVAQGGGNYRINLPDATFIVSGVVSNDGGSLVPTANASIVAQGGGNIVAAGAGNFNPNTLISQDGGSIMRAIASIVAQGGGNVVSTNSGNLLPSTASLMQNMANYMPDASSFRGGDAFAFSNGSSSSDILPLAVGSGRNAYAEGLKQAIERCGERNVEFAVSTSQYGRAYALLTDLPPETFGTARSRLAGYVCKMNASGWPHYSGSWDAQPAAVAKTTVTTTTTTTTTTTAPPMQLNVHDTAPGYPQGFFLIANHDAWHFAPNSARITKQPNGSAFVVAAGAFFTITPEGAITVDGMPITTAGVGDVTASGPAPNARVLTTPQAIATLAKMIVANGIVTNATPVTAHAPAPVPAPLPTTLDYADIERTHGDLRTTRDILAANGMVPFSTAYRPSDLPLMFMQSTRDVAAYRHGDKGVCGGYVMILNGRKYAERIPASLLPQVISFACKGDAIAAGFTHE